MQRTLWQQRSKDKIILLSPYHREWLPKGKATLNRKSSSVFFVFLSVFLTVSLVNAAPQYPYNPQYQYPPQYPNQRIVYIYPAPFYKGAYNKEWFLPQLSPQNYKPVGINLNQNDGQPQPVDINFNSDQIPTDISQPQHTSTLDNDGNGDLPSPSQESGDTGLSSTPSMPVGGQENLLASNSDSGSSSTSDAPTATTTPVKIEPLYPLGLSKSAFIVLVTLSVLISFLSICGIILFYVRHRRNTHFVRPQYKALKILAERTYDSRASLDRPSTTLLPAREFLFPTPLSAAHHKTIYGAKNADAAVWDVKADVERRSTIRVPKTRKTWFPALQSRSIPSKEKKEPSSEEKKLERARKTTSWFAAFKLSSDDSNANDTTNQSSNTVADAEKGQVILPSPPVPAMSKTTGFADPEFLDIAAENAKKAFLAGLDLRDSRKPKLPLAATPDSNVAANSSLAHRIKLGGRLEKVESQVPRNEKRDKQIKDISSSNSSIPKTKSGDSPTQDPSSRRSNIIRRETLRPKSAAANAARRSMKLAKSEMPSLNQDTSMNNTSSTNVTSASEDFCPPPLPVKRQSLFGETVMDLEKFSKAD